MKNKVDIVGISRVRNEELILEDTLDHVSQFVDTIIMLDDRSHDNTLKIIQEYPEVSLFMSNDAWCENRIFEETRHRHLLLEQAKKLNPKWIFYFDADERFVGISKKVLLQSNKYDKVDGIRLFVFDAYMTTDDCDPVIMGEKLFNHRNYFGPEYREILMLWKNLPHISFEGLDAREPTGCQNVITEFFCQHYGKAISVNEWEDTCDYYSRHFPEPYKSKWLSRKGKAIHISSDFNGPLYSWEELINNHTIWVKM